VTSVIFAFTDRRYKSVESLTFTAPKPNSVVANKFCTQYNATAQNTDKWVNNHEDKFIPTTERLDN